MKQLTEQDVNTLTEVMNGLKAKRLRVSIRSGYADAIQTILTRPETVQSTVTNLDVKPKTKAPNKAQQIHDMYKQDKSNAKLLYRVIKYLKTRTIDYAYRRAYEVKYCKQCNDINLAAKEFAPEYQKLKKSGYIGFNQDNTLFVK